MSGRAVTAATLATIALASGWLHAQAPPVRVDFEASVPKAAAPAAPPHVSGPPVRVDFEAGLPKTAAPAAAARVTGAPLRVDFEAPLARSGSTAAAAPASAPQSRPNRSQGQQPNQPPPQPNQPQGKAGQPQGQPNQPQGLTAPVITGLQPQCLRPGARITVVGRGFGQAGADRRLVVAGQAMVALEVSGWNDASITAVIPPNARFDPQLKYTIGIQDRTSRLITNPFTAAACR